jgi:HPt (histidine-containing phosphotransfer) domain-containing protein
VRPAHGSSGGVLSFDLEQAVKRSFGLYDVFQDLVEYFYEAGEGLSEQMQTALLRRDAAQLARLAHKLTNTVLYLGCPEVLQNLRQIEHEGRHGKLAVTEMQTLTQQMAIMYQVLAPHRRRK